GEALIKTEGRLNRWFRADRPFGNLPTGLFVQIRRARQASGRRSWEAVVFNTRFARSIEDLYASRGTPSKSSHWLYRRRMMDIPPFFPLDVQKSTDSDDR